MGAAAVALAAVCTAAPVTAQIDAGRLVRDLSVLAHDSMAGRAIGTAGSQRARVFLRAELRAAGIGPARGSLESPFTWGGRRGVNVVAMVPGQGEPDDDVIVLTAHYDHLGIRDGQIYNGADDNASGVAALLEIGRQLWAEPLAHTVILAFVDGEEGGMRGSSALVADPPVPLDRIALNVNLDMVARTDGLLWAGGAYHTPALRPILESVAKAVSGVELRLGHDRPNAPEGEDWTDSSDHAPFHRIGIPFVYFGVEDHADYHEPTDDVERIDPKELTAAVEAILMGLRALDAALPLNEPASR